MPILRLATSKNLNLIKHIFAINVSGEQFLSEFSDCFGEIGTLRNTHHIEIKDNVIPVVISKDTPRFEAKIRKGIKMYD